MLYQGMKQNQIFKNVLLCYPSRKGCVLMFCNIPFKQFFLLQSTRNLLKSIRFVSEYKKFGYVRSSCLAVEIDTKNVVLIVR